MPLPLIVTKAHLEGHFQRVEGIVAAAVDASVDVHIAIDWPVSPLVSGLHGDGCEFIPRNRGLRTPVAPLLHLGQGLWAWLGYREEWDEEQQVGRTRRFSFRSIGLTVHFGLKNDPFKPQMFRAEWAGWAKWVGGQYSFQAGNAGHPHWQFDVLESLPDDALAQRAEAVLNLLREAAEQQIQDLPQLATPEICEVVTAQKISRIHFASAAAWWKQAPHDEHAHGPATTHDLQIWAQRSLGYLSAELNRL